MSAQIEQIANLTFSVATFAQHVGERDGRLSDRSERCRLSCGHVQVQRSSALLLSSQCSDEGSETRRAGRTGSVCVEIEGDLVTHEVRLGRWRWLCGAQQVSFEDN